MPELPEVETTKRGVAPHVTGARIAHIAVHDGRLRWPVPAELPATASGHRVAEVTRRAKYLLFELADGPAAGSALILHLGMSGSLRYLPGAAARLKHDHVDIVFSHGGRLRFNDPRRFGCLLLSDAPADHPLLRHLGPEPLGDAFTADYLKRSCQGRRCSIKQHIMNAQVVTGVGNIYANEALFRAGIRPSRQAGRIAQPRLAALVQAIKDVLQEAIEVGGTTLRDYVSSDGTPGYFRQSLSVYERAGEACRQCGQPVRRQVLGQRATYFCQHCQR